MKKQSTTRSKRTLGSTNGADSFPFVQRWLLYLTVIVSGAAVMVLELLGTRIIAPFYGVSLYVWSSLISVTLIALALGYYLGGYLADRSAAIRLAHVILLAALATAVIPLISGPVLTLTDPLGIRAGGFVSALALFGLPLTVLAMVGPFVIKMATRDLLGVGKAAGSVYAVSTLGSVAGTLLLGFYLLPQFGTRSILFSLSVMLLALALLLAWKDRAHRAAAIAPGAVAIVALVVAVLTANGYAKSLQPVDGFEVLHEAESTYGWVRVVDDKRNGYRLLLSDSSVLSAMDIGQRRTLLGYQAVIGMLPIFRPEATTALLIGLGGGHIASDLKAKGLATDTIEIDPAVAAAAREFFHFEPTGAFIVGDARYEIKRLTKAYDFVIHDCFTGGSEPTHMLTREMFQQLQRLLSNQGVLVLNYVGFSNGEGVDAVASVYQTLQSLFPHLRIFITEKTDLTDFIFVASARPLDLDRRSADPRVRWLLEHERGVPDGRGVVIADDFNPMEHLQVRKAETYRKLFMERVALELLIR